MAGLIVPRLVPPVGRLPREIPAHEQALRPDARSQLFRDLLQKRARRPLPRIQLRAEGDVGHFCAPGKRAPQDEKVTVRRRLIGDGRRPLHAKGLDAKAKAMFHPAPECGLLDDTPTEKSICVMIRSGLSSKEIARLRNVAEGTVSRHRENIRKKLGLRNAGRNLVTYLNTLNLD